jgi:hypothetical protein
MASIGSVSCTFVRGHAPAVKQRLELWTVPGINGYGALALGANDSEFEFTAVLYSDDAGLLEWKLSIEAQQGQIISVVNDLGITYANCLVTKISNLRNTPVVAAGGISQRGEIQISGVTTQ